MHAFFNAVARFSVRFRWFIVIAWVAATVLTVTFLPTLSSVSKTNNADFLPANSPSLQAAQLATPFQKLDQTPVPVVVVRNGQPLTAADHDAISSLLGRFAKVANVVAVKDAGPSPDQQAEQLVVIAQFSQGSGNDRAGKALVDNLRTAIAQTALPAGLQAHVAGQLASQVDTQAQSGVQSNEIDLISIVFIFVLLLLIFRSLLAPIVTLIPAALTAQLAGPIVAEATKIGLQVSALTQFMLIVLVLGAGTDYGLFLVFRVREELRAGLAPRDAIVRALGRVGESITFSAATVIAALLSLLAATFGIYKSLGAPLAIGIAIMLLAGLTLLPALLAILGRAVFWPSNTRISNTKGGLWGRVSARIVQRPALTLAVGLVFFGALAIGSVNNKPAGFGGSTSAPAGSDSALGNQAIAQHFPISAANPTNVIFRLSQPVWQDPTPLTTASQELPKDPVFKSVVGPLNPNGATLTVQEYLDLRSKLGPANALPPVPPAGAPVSAEQYQVYRATANYVSADGKTIQFETSLAAGDPSSTAALQAVPAVRQAVANVAKDMGASASGVAGEALALYDVSSASNRDLRQVIPIAIVVIGLLLAVVMRSAVAPLYLIASVALSYIAALGLAVIVFIDLGSAGGLSFFLPFLLFLFLLALGEDYNILVMTRIREEAHNMPLKWAVQRALSVTGTTVTSAGLVLAGTFAVFAVVVGTGAGTEQFRAIGFGLALGILMDTFLVRTLLVPSTAVLLGRWNWWPSKLGVAIPKEVPSEATKIAAGLAGESDMEAGAKKGDEPDLAPHS